MFRSFAKEALFLRFDVLASLLGFFFDRLVRFLFFISFATPFPCSQLARFCSSHLSCGSNQQDPFPAGNRSRRTNERTNNPTNERSTACVQINGFECVATMATEREREKEKRRSKRVDISRIHKQLCMDLLLKDQTRQDVRCRPRPSSYVRKTNKTKS